MFFRRRLWTVKPTWIKLENALAPNASSKLIIIGHSTSSTLTFYFAQVCVFIIPPFVNKVQRCGSFLIKWNSTLFVQVPCTFPVASLRAQATQNSLQQHFWRVLPAIHLLWSKAACISPAVAMSRLGVGGAACRYKMADILTVNRGHFILSQSWTRLFFLGSITNEVHNKLGAILIFRGFFVLSPSKALLEGNWAGKHPAVARRQ